MTKSLQLNFVSDTVCPWCYVGKKRLDKALTVFTKTPVSFMWRPFRLEANIPSEGMDYDEYIKLRFGDAGQPKETLDAIAQAGEEEGINFNFSNISAYPNTLNAHRLIRWAGTAGFQNDVVMRLFKAYFEEGEDTGQTEVLVAIAKQAGLNADLIAELLESDCDIDEVQKEIAAARPKGITGVPTYVAGMSLAIVGAQNVEAIIDLLEQATAQAAAASN